jgi:hypothetical protein
VKLETISPQPTLFGGIGYDSRIYMTLECENCEAIVDAKEVAEHYKPLVILHGAALGTMEPKETWFLGKSSEGRLLALP